MDKSILLDRMATPTKEQIEMLDNASKMPIIYDDDSPEMTEDMERAFILATKARNRYLGK